MLARSARSATWVWLAVAACSPGTEYPCDADVQCIDAGIMGMCQSPGWCSFPDPACESGQRYGELAGDDLALECVADAGSTGLADDDSATATTPTSPESSAETASDPSSTNTLSTTTPLTTGVDATGQPDATSADATSTSSVDESATAPSTTDDGTTGTSPECPTYVDDFEDGVIGPEWDVYLPDLVTDDAGARVYVVSTDGRDGYPATMLMESQDLRQGWARVRVGAPPSHNQEQLFLMVTPVDDPNDVLLWFIEGNSLLARRQDLAAGGWLDIQEVVFDPEAHRWLRIRGDDTTMHFEVAAEDEAFEVIASYELEYALDDVFVSISAGNWGAIDLVAELSFEHFEVCSPP